MEFFGSCLEEEKRKVIRESAPTRENKCSKASMQTFLGQCKARTVRIPNSFKLNCGLSTSPTSSGTANQIYRTDQIPMAMEPGSGRQNSRLLVPVKKESRPDLTYQRNHHQRVEQSKGWRESSDGTA